MSTIEGIVGSIKCERDTDSDTVNITIQYHQGHSDCARVTRQVVDEILIPALKCPFSGGSWSNRLPIGEGIETHWDEYKLHINPRYHAYTYGNEVILNGSQASTLIKLLRGPKKGFFSRF